MKSVQSLAVLGFVAAVQAAYPYSNTTTTSSVPVVYTTLTTDIYTTYCPEATTFTQGTKTYTATASETLTITDCPCTYSHAVGPTSTPTPQSYVPPPPPPSNNATYTPVWVTTTEVVATYTTYCPEATTVVQGSNTYTVTEATTLVITDCPCTATKTYPGTTTVISVGSSTTYCPEPTTITIGLSTYPVTAPGTVTFPVYSTAVVPITSYPASSPVVPATTPVGGGFASASTATPKPTGPVPITANGAGVRSVGLGAMVAGLVAMVL